VSEESKEKGRDIIKKCDKLFSSSERENARTTWEILSEFILPNQSGIFIGNDTKGSKKTARLFDGTAPRANVDLASAFQSTITNPASKWSKLVFPDDARNNDRESLAWLEDTNNRIHDAFNQSNFDTQVAKNYQAFTALATMVLFHEEEQRDLAGTFKGMRFEAWHLSQVAFAENVSGAVDTIYRKFKWTAKQALERFKEATPVKVMEASEKDPSKEFEFIHGIYPRNPKEVFINEQGLARATERPFASIYVSKDEGEVVEEGGYYEFPVYANRWSTLPGEVYGRGPGHLALPDVRSLNKVKELSLAAIAKAVNPPLLAQARNVIGSLRLSPSSVTIVKDINGIREMVPQARFDVTQFAVDDLRQAIKESFFLDKLLLPPRTETGEMTAFEVQQRLEQMQKVLGPILSRLNSEFLSPLIIRMFKMLLRAGALAPLPPMLEELGVDIDITFLNSLARSQQAEDVANITAWVQELMQLAQADPSVIDNINSDGIATHIAKIRSVPDIAIMPPEQVEEIRAQRAEAAQKQQQMDQAVQMADVAAKIPQGEQPQQ
jgi:hypothetical protein